MTFIVRTRNRILGFVTRWPDYLLFGHLPQWKVAQNHERSCQSCNHYYCRENTSKRYFHSFKQFVRNKNYRPQRDTNSGLRNEKESMLTTWTPPITIYFLFSVLSRRTILSPRTRLWIHCDPLLCRFEFLFETFEPKIERLFFSQEWVFTFFWIRFQFSPSSCHFISSTQKQLFADKNDDCEWFRDLGPIP